MIENLGTALQSLRQTIADNVDTPIVLPQEALERQFHGLSLSQLVVLTEAPVLAVAGQLRLADGTRVERFVIDGKDAQQRASLARRLLLDTNAAIEPGHAREILELDGGALRATLLRDHNDVVYQLRDGHAAVDEELTAALQRQRRPTPRPEPRTATPPAGRHPVIISDPIGFYGTAGEILHGLAALQGHNRAVAQALQNLARASNEAGAEGVRPDLLSATFQQILSAAQEIGGLVDALNMRMTSLLRLVERAEASPADATPESMTGAVRGLDPPL